MRADGLSYFLFLGSEAGVLGVVEPSPSLSEFLLQCQIVDGLGVVSVVDKI